jgi:hypothetical protein
MTPTAQELRTIHAETLAIQAVLTNVLYELKLLDPILANAIARGFDNAASQVEIFAMQDKAVPSEPLVKALGIIESPFQNFIKGCRAFAT